MVRSLLPILLLSALVGSSLALSESGEAAKQELFNAIKAEDEDRSKPGSPGSGKSGTAYMRNLDEAANQANKQQIEYSLNQIAQNYRSPAVSQALEKLQAALNAEAKVQEDAELARIDALLKEVSQVVQKAAKTKDLDAILEKMDKLMEGRSERRSEKVSAAYQSIRPVKQFVATWQDYLQALGSRNRTLANQILRSLISANGPIPVPRSVVIALIDNSTPPPPGAGSGVPTEIKELDQLAPALRQLRAMTMTDRANSQNPDLMGIELSIRTLVPLEKAYQDFNAGLPTNLDFVIKPNDPQAAANATSVSGLKAKLLLLILPRHLGIPQNSAPKPTENVTQFLDRVEKEAGERGDATVCAKVMETRLALDPSESPAAPKAAALAAFRAAQAREAAGQPMLAAISYQMALKFGITPPLAALIGKRLDEIKRTHPEESRQAAEQILKGD